MSQNTDKGCFAELNAFSLLVARTSGAEAPFVIEDLKEAGIDNKGALEQALSGVLPERQGGGVKVACSVRAKRRFLHLASADQARACATGAALASFVRQGELAAFPNPEFSAVRARDGAAIDSEPWVLAGADRDSVGQALSSLAGWQIPARRLSPAILATCGGLLSTIPSDGAPVVVWEIGDTGSHLLLLGPDGVTAVRVLSFGFDKVAEGTQLALGLKFKGAAAKLFFNELYDFTDPGPKVAAQVALLLKPEIDALVAGAARPPAFLFCAGLPARQQWFSNNLAASVGLKPYEADLKTWCSQRGLKFASADMEAGLSMAWIGFLYMLSVLKTDEAAAPAWMGSWSVSVAAAAPAAMPVAARPAVSAAPLPVVVRAPRPAVVPAPVVAPKPVAPKPVSAAPIPVVTPRPAAPAPVAALRPVTPVPVVAPRPAVAPAPVVAPKPVAPVPVVAPKPVSAAPMPVAAPAPKPVIAPVPVVAPKPVEVPSAVTPVPVPKPAVSAPVEAPKPVEAVPAPEPEPAPAPVVEPKPVEPAVVVAPPAQAKPSSRPPMEAGLEEEEEMSKSAEAPKSPMTVSSPRTIVPFASQQNRIATPKPATERPTRAAEQAKVAKVEPGKKKASEDRQEPARPEPEKAKPARKPAPPPPAVRPPSTAGSGDAIAAPAPKPSFFKTPGGVIAVVIIIALLAGGGFYVYKTQQAAKKVREEKERYEAQEASRRAEAEAQKAEERRIEEERIRKEEEARRAEEERLAAEEAARKQAEEQARLEQERLANARGGLTLTTEPAGASVVIGNDPPRTAPLDLPATELHIGKLPVVVSLDGYEPVTTEIEIRENDITHMGAVTLRPFEGALNITSTPPGLHYVIRPPEGVTLDPSVIPLTGETPVTIEHLPLGDYRVTISRAGWPDNISGVPVERNETARVIGIFPSGSVTITSTPEGATVSSGGKALGVTPLAIKDLAPGEVAYDLDLAGHDSITVKGMVEVDRETSLSATLMVGDRIYPIREVDVKPAPLSTKQPDLPRILQRDGGKVTISMIVDKEGVPQDLRVEKTTDRELDSYCLAAAKEWRFSPAQVAGKPVRVRLQIPFTIVP